MNRKEQLEKELKDIKTKERDDARAKQEQWTKTLGLFRTITLSDGQYKVVFNEEYGQDLPHPDKAVELLKSKTLVVRHDFGGEVMDVLNVNVATVKQPQEAFSPIDKGRPSNVLCDAKGKAMFSFAVYDDGTLIIYQVSEVHVW